MAWVDKYSDLYEIVPPSLNLIFLCLVTGVECGKGLLGKKVMIFVFLHLCFLFAQFAPELVDKIFGLFLSQKPG